MASFTDVANGASAQASDVQQLIDAAKGTTGKGVPISYTAVNDAVNFALAVKNNDATASKAFIVYKSDGTVLFQADKNGVIASADGVTGAAQIPTLTAAQTFTNKTLASPTLTGTVGIGVAPSASSSLLIGGTSTQVYGLLLQNTLNPVGSSSAAYLNTTFGLAVTNAEALQTRITTVTGAMTVTSAADIHVYAPSLGGGGAAITNKYGMLIDNQGAAGVTNAYGLYVNTPSGAATANLPIYIAGTGTGAAFRVDNTAVTTVGAAGAGSAPPASPQEYLIININGNLRKLACYLP